MYKEVANYSAEENEVVTMDMVERIYDGEKVYIPSGVYVDEVQINGIWCDVYEDNGDYTAYMDITDDNDDYGEMIDRRYQEYVDSKYEN